MTFLNEKNYNAEFLVSEANGYRAIEEYTLPQGATNVFNAGDILHVNATGELKAYLSTDDFPVVVLREDTDASVVAKKKVVVYERDCVVATDLVNYTGDATTAPKKLAVDAKMKAQGIMRRTSNVLSE